MGNSSESTIANLVRETRQLRFKTAKDYWNKFQHELDVTYPHYSSIETGARFPDIRLAVAIGRTLEIDLKLVCHLWAKDQMPDEQTQAFFEPRPGLERHGVPATANVELDSFYIFSDKQAGFLESQPRTWDILIFINASTPMASLTEKQISTFLKVDLSTVKNAVRWLIDEGLIASEKGTLRTTRKFYHLPNTDVFRGVRDANFISRAQDVVRGILTKDLASKEAYRTTFGRRISRNQAKALSAHIDDLVAHLGDMKDEGGEYYSLVVGFVPRASDYIIPSEFKSTK